MISTTVFECNCDATWYDGKIISVSICEKHLKEHPELLELMVKILKEIHGLK